MRLAAEAGLTQPQAAELGWCELEQLAMAHRRIRANQMLDQMVAAQGDEKSWKQQVRRLLKIVADK